MDRPASRPAEVLVRSPRWGHRTRWCVRSSSHCQRNVNTNKCQTATSSLSILDSTCHRPFPAHIYLPSGMKRRNFLPGYSEISGTPEIRPKSHSYKLILTPTTSPMLLMGLRTAMELYWTGVPLPVLILSLYSVTRCCCVGSWLTPLTVSLVISI